MIIVLLPTQVEKAKDELSSSEEHVAEKELSPSTHHRATPHPRKYLLKLRISTDSSNSDSGSSSSITRCSCGHPDYD